MMGKESISAACRVGVFAFLACICLALSGGDRAWAGATWTKGTKTVLIIPVRFTDQAGPSDAPGPGGYLSGWGKVVDGTTPAALNAFFEEQSYGQCHLTFTLIPEIDLGVSYTAYNANYGSTGLSKYTEWFMPGSLADDVRAKARQVGLGTATPALYDSDNYDLDIIATGFIPGQGTLASGQPYIKGVYGNTFKALAHELCHNFGLQHANGVSRATTFSPLKGGTYFSDPYGDVFDLMGYKDTAPIPIPPDREINPFSKWKLGWLTMANVASPSASGTYRTYAFDAGSVEAGKDYAIRIERDSNLVYWLDYRNAITGPDAVWSSNGLEVHFGGESIPATAGQTQLLDTTPGSRGLLGGKFATMHDAALGIGRTYTDAEANLSITPIKKGGTTPESLDVVVNFGPFPGNVAPTAAIAPPAVALTAGAAQTFTVTAADADGDPLSYAWEFDDVNEQGGTKAGGLNPDARLAVQGSHTWTTNGVYFVRCTASDMKGHTATATSQVTVTGGTGGPLTISGFVRDENGDPLAGAIVNNYRTTAPATTYGDAGFVGSSVTGADGKYIIPLPNGAGTYLLTAMSQGFRFSCNYGGGSVPVNASNVANVNFTRLRATRTVSGAVVVAGRGYNPATDGPLSISDGTQSVQAGLGSWTMNEPDGAAVTFTATPPNPACTVLNFFPNPFFVVDDYNLLHFSVNIPGAMPEVEFGAIGAASDDTAGTVQVPIVMTLPDGMVSWPADQAIYCWIDESSTAEYGVDYKMSGGGQATFKGGVPPAPQYLTLKIIHNGLPKNKKLVLKMGPAMSITNTGPRTTYTYSINNVITSAKYWTNY